MFIEKDGLIELYLWWNHLSPMGLDGVEREGEKE